MNYLCHGHPFLDRPYFVAGTAIPDWLNVVDRKTRVRRKHAEQTLEIDDPVFREIASGVIQHHQDDDWFHSTRAFAEMSLQFAVLIRDNLSLDDGLRPSFLGHILVELLLDDCVAQANPGLLTSYYDVLKSIDPDQVTAFVQRATGRPVEKLSHLIERFVEVRFLNDYADNAKLLFRLNQVMRRVGLAQIPDTFVDLLPQMRAAVNQRQNELLNPTPRA